MHAHRRTIITATALLATAISLAGCGGSDESSKAVSAATRIDRCVDEYPDATKDECSDWESEGKLNDDGTHAEHDSE